MMVLVRPRSRRWRRRSAAGRRRGPDGRLVTDGDSSTVVRHAISAVLVGSLVAEVAARCRAEPGDLCAAMRVALPACRCPVLP